MKTLPLYLAFLAAAAQAQTNPAPPAQLRPLNGPASTARASSSSSSSTSSDTGTSSPPESIKFSDPAKPGTLKLRVSRGNVHIRGGDGSEVTVQTRLKADRPDRRDDGLRVFSTSSSYSLTEKDNVVTLDYGHGAGSSPNADFTVTVPRRTAIVASNGLGGEIACSDLDGNLEIRNLNGRVRLDNVSGGALVETTNGEITASFRQLNPGQPLSFTSINGRVQLYLPDAAKANVQLRTRNGSVLTDFDDKELVVGNPDLTRENTAADAGDRKVKHRDRDTDDDDDSGNFTPRDLPPITGGKTVSGKLNGGGPEILAATMNGDVILRKLSSRQSQPEE